MTKEQRELLRVLAQIVITPVLNGPINHQQRRMLEVLLDKEQFAHDRLMSGLLSEQQASKETV